MDSLIASKIAIMLQESILNGEIVKDSPMKILTKGIEIMESFPNMSGEQRKIMLIKVVEKIAAGADGIAGTEDDIIPVNVVTSLKLLLEKDLIGDIVEVITSAAKGEFNINKAKESAIEVVEVTKVCCPSFLSKFTKMLKK